MSEAYICDGIRTPFGRYGGGLATIRTDDLAALTLRAICERNPCLNPEQIDDILFGCANQAGEDNRNVGRMAALLAGLPYSVPGCTINRLCGSSLDAIAQTSRAIKSGEMDVLLAGGVESMSRAPFVLGKADSAFSRSQKIEDTTMGWRFVNTRMKELYGTETMPETAENLATELCISREDQDAFALRSQQRTGKAQAAGYLSEEIVSVEIKGKKMESHWVSVDEHPRQNVSLADLEKLRGVVRSDGTVTAGNSSGINDGAAVLLLASEEAIKRHSLTPKARIVASMVAGVPPRIMGIGPVPAVRKLLEKSGVSLGEIGVIELNEAFAAQSLAVLRELGLPDDAPQVNPNGGAIALGHPLGASGARLAIAAVNQLVRSRERYALCTMCIGVGQGIALLMERV